MFQRILTRDNIDNVSRANTAESLALINLLTKISNSPILLKATADQAKVQGDDGGVKAQAIQDALKLLPERAQIDDVSLSGKISPNLQLDRVLIRPYSGKLAALANLLRAIYKVCLRRLNRIMRLTVNRRIRTKNAS